jgi:hypothetical protein
MLSRASTSGLHPAQIGLEPWRVGFAEAWRQCHDADDRSGNRNKFGEGPGGDNGDSTAQSNHGSDRLRSGNGGFCGRGRSSVSRRLHQVHDHESQRPRLRLGELLQQPLGSIWPSPPGNLLLQLPALLLAARSMANRKSGADDHAQYAAMSFEFRERNELRLDPIGRRTADIGGAVEAPTLVLVRTAAQGRRPTRTLVARQLPGSTSIRSDQHLVDVADC